MVYTPVSIQATAQQEFNDYLAAQARVIAPARIDRVDATATYTYLSAIDEDRPAEPLTRLMVQLENDQGNEHLVDVVTNNDGLVFMTRVIRNTIDPAWKITESWTPTEPF
jgi:hypothetical protein